MNPFERWDDWEWEKAVQEVGRERGYRQKGRREKIPLARTRRDGGGFFRHWSGLQKRTLLAGVVLITLALSARHTDPVSQGIYAFYQGAMTADYYSALNDMAKDAFRLSRTGSGALAVDAGMSGKFQAPVSGQVMAGFGLINKTDQTTHQGIDVGSALGTRVLAPYAGVVTALAQDEQLGKTVKIDFGDGWTCILGNLGDIYVAEGQKINQGETVGSVGLSAPLKKPWLHFELRYNNQPVDPLPYLASATAKQ
ncbi:MAG: M23 family metallopeptidase [Peptococcaceae bacterium]|jgi:murein DD-endopeptidase MepM/ murein hydrolase activator NlpD|nr:M23 family metallopeptidase [Peptococcaceae bacterium]